MKTATASMRPKGSKSLERVFVLASSLLALAMCMCNHRVDAFCPTTHRSTSTAIPTSVHLSPKFSNYQRRYLLSSITRPMDVPIYSSVSPNAAESSDESPRSKLRQLTGFSLTALRATLRAATGISLSQTISGTMRRILGILSPGMRYFLQPFLIMYYAPLLMVRYWVVGPSHQYVMDSRKGHEKMVDGWRKAVEAAEMANAGGYWPVHLNDDGTITTSLPPDPNDVLDLTDGIEQSVAAATVATSESLSP